MKRRNITIADDESQPVMVPRNNKALVAVSPARVWRLREHLIQQLSELRTMGHPDRIASRARAEPAGFPAAVARAACSLCKGSCCRNGADNAFLDDRTLARVRLAKPEMTDGDALQFYLDRVPAAACQDSCIFHGERGCTLARSMRADVCNTYYCGGLGAVMESKANLGPIIVIAGEGDSMRTSPVLRP